MTAGRNDWRERLRQALIERRTALRRALRSNARTLGENAASQVDVADVVDMASGDAADNLAAGLAEIESGQLAQIEEALRRLEDGTYGQCLDCGKPIPQARRRWCHLRRGASNASRHATEGDSVAVDVSGIGISNALVQVHDAQAMRACAAPCVRSS